MLRKKTQSSENVLFVDTYVFPTPCLFQVFLILNKNIHCKEINMVKLMTCDCHLREFLNLTDAAAFYQSYSIVYTESLLWKNCITAGSDYIFDELINTFVQSL